MSNSFRQEVKHFISFSDYLAISSRLRAIMPLDKNSKSNREYKIRSLYFENYDNKVLKEKINGVNHREKFRIRFYNDDDSFIRLEKKSKMNSLCKKESIEIARDECEKIIKGDLQFLLLSEKKLFNELYYKMKTQLLKPKTIVDYNREAYTYKAGNVRITFDKNVCTGVNSIKLFEKNLKTVKVSENNSIILEVKYDEFLPEIIQDIIQTNNSRQTAISKYAASRIFG